MTKPEKACPCAQCDNPGCTCAGRSEKREGECCCGSACRCGQACACPPGCGCSAADKG